MDKETLQNMPEYVKNLPKAVQDFVFDGEWEVRTGEIGKKYSLNDSQTETLIDTTLYILIGLETPDTFLQNIITELGISRLLAEQIMADLETRVFEYALNTIEGKQGTKEMNREVKTENKTVKPTEKPINVSFPQFKTEGASPKTVPVVPPSKIPEIKPNTLPAVEKGEVAHNTPKPAPEVPKNLPTEPKAPSVPQYGGVETVQRPVSVPRFSAFGDEKGDTKDWMGEPKQDQVKIPTLKEMMESKLSGTTAPLTDPKQEEKKPTQIKYTSNYTTDPYREPLE